MKALQKKQPELTAAELQEWFRLVRITKTTRASLASARQSLEAMSDGRVQRLIALGMHHLREHLDVPSFMNNLRHVEDQLLRPVLEDAEELATAFGVEPARFRLLVILHDLGKAGIPASLSAIWARIFPNDYVAREILVHEYASMLWIEVLAKDAGLPAEEVLALQQLIANHNFGPNLLLAKNKALRAHWWPSKFREKIFPTLEQLGFDLSSTYEKSEDGMWQYNHSEDDVYAALLAAYDRAIATKYNNFGAGTWQKFAQQDYLDWQAESLRGKKTPSAFNAIELTENMFGSAGRARVEIRETWKILFEKHLQPSARSNFRLEEFAPYRRQIDGIERLLGVIERVRAANPTNAGNSLVYTTEAGDKWRVVADAPKATLEIWDGDLESWTLVAEDSSPIKLYFQILQGDL